MSENTTPLPDTLIGQLVDGKYRIDRELGRGGMGSVYRATHVGTDRPVAVKVISSAHLGNREVVERFSREAKAAGQLRHPNVVNVTDFGVWEREPSPVAYLVMEYLDGISLGDVLKEEKRLPLPWVVEILEQVCVAMEKAHARGIIHRDLKPDNIWLEPNDLGGYTVKVLDFGLARLSVQAEEVDLDQPTALLGSRDAESTRLRIEHESPSTSTPASSPHLTTAGSILGTPHYMAPEQCSGQPADHRADIYSLGVIAYEMLTGERPFPGKTTAEVIQQHVNAMPKPAHETRKSVPRGVSDLVARAMAKSPGERPASAAGFASALRARSEGLGATLRRAFLLYTEHFGTLLLIALLAYIPMILTTAYEATIDKITPVAVLASLFFGFIAFPLTISVSIGLIVPAVAHLLVRPLSPIRVRAAIERLRERAVPFAISSLLFYALLLAVLLGFGMLVGITVGVSGVTGDRIESGSSRIESPRAPTTGEGAPASTSTASDENAPASAKGKKKGILIAVLAGSAILALAIIIGLVKGVQKLVKALLYGPAVIMEEITGPEAIRRSRALAQRIVRPLIGWTILLVLWFGILEGLDMFLINPQHPRIDGLAKVAWVAASLATTILFHPIVITGLALLYFKARQSEGETLAEILQVYEKDLPAQEYRRSVAFPSSFTSGRPRLL